MGCFCRFSAIGSESAFLRPSRLRAAKSSSRGGLHNDRGLRVGGDRRAWFHSGKTHNCTRQPDIAGGAIKAPVLKYDGVRFARYPFVVLYRFL